MAKSRKGRKNKSTKNQDDIFRAIESLKRLFTQYKFEDVAPVLLTSELWIPNRSSGVKHQLAWGVLGTIKADDFKGRHQLNSFQDFISFHRTLFSLIPRLPMLEDFVPQADWGEIKCVYSNTVYQVFFGGSIERITDFIKAFEIIHCTCPDADLHMELALNTQQHFLSEISKNLAGNPNSVRPGDVSIPSERFWMSVQCALKSFNQSIDKAAIEESFIVDIGNNEIPENAAYFSDSIMQGTFQQFLFLRNIDTLYPVSLRNFPSFVIDHWDREETKSILDFEHYSKLNSLIISNIETHTPGPCILDVADLEEPITLTSLINSSEIFFLPIPITAKQLENVTKIADSIYSHFEDSDDIEFFSPSGKASFKLSDELTPQNQNQNVKLLFVLMKASMSISFIEPPTEPSYLVPLSDLVSLLSSYDRDDSLLDILSFEKDHHFGPMTGLIDRLAAYKDSNSVLIEGTAQPDNIILDPHYGCEWRYKTLLNFWEKAPNFFPIKNKEWLVENDYDGIKSVVTKTGRYMSWFTKVGECEIHFICSFGNQKLDLNNFRVLRLAAECLTDACKQREEIIKNLKIFSNKQVHIFCEANLDSLITDDKSESSIDSFINDALFENWFLPKTSEDFPQVKVQLNLNVFAAHFESAKDSSAQANCLEQMLITLSGLLDFEIDKTVVEAIRKTASRPARMKLEQIQQNVAVPEVANYSEVPPKFYKEARKELAFTFLRLGIAPGTYQLLEAKSIMNDAISAYRDAIHNLIKRYKKNELIKLIIESHERLITHYDTNQRRVRMSLGHEVSYNRAEMYSKSSVEKTRSSRNLRYLVEFAVSTDFDEDETPTENDLRMLLGRVDWLIVLYDASDTLHYGIDVGGINIADDNVPEVFFSEEKETAELEFRKSDAKNKLGIGSNSSEELIVTDAKQLEEFFSAFKRQFGFEFTLLLNILDVLSTWSFYHEDVKAAFSYTTKRENLIDFLRKELAETSNEIVESAISFLTLDGSKTRLLLGKTSPEPDVPIWEHNKRPYRYTIRPMVAHSDEYISWGANATKNALTIWKNSIIEGYLPCDLGSTPIENAVRKIKKFLETQLEVLAYNVTKDFAPYLIRGIDFYRRFPKHNFEDVGDYDVLAYWPEANVWLTIECKYIQPPFCFKDSKRLRDKMFKNNRNDSHFCKIQKKTNFLNENHRLMRELLDWPEPQGQSELTVRELYVSKNTYWWMYSPPYTVAADFVQIDLLRSWLEERQEFQKPA
ncbi:hypothetical protein [Alteromonas stellipolaris]|uniref:hypothetical protein n=1 Tax=Alteromonas stellipolaris TaxID=233316 RepID=UPI0027341C94|nr:hypothetical protein [Alteromonas stellipolaris]MDP2596389.1 hypothetical protein [Alteromonas stellipolaris]